MGKNQGEEEPAEIVTDVRAVGMALAIRPRMQAAAATAAANAAVTVDETRSVSEEAGTFCAFLCLRQGASERASWVIEEALGGTMISVGADEACDWQVRAAFVPPRAFSLLVVGGRTFVRSGPEQGVLLNGKAIDDGWIQVPNGGRIDVGLARLEVTMGYGYPSGSLTETLPDSLPNSLTETLPEVELSSRRSAASPAPASRSHDGFGRATLDLGVMPMDAEPLPLTTPRAKPAAPRRTQPSIERALEELYMDADVGSREQDVQGALSDQVPQARMLGHESGEFDTFRRSRASTDTGAAGDFSAPSLLDDPASATDKRRWWLYAVAGVVIAGAYGGWIVLLDFL